MIEKSSSPTAVPCPNLSVPDRDLSCTQSNLPFAPHSFNSFPNAKRQVLQQCCSRLLSSNLVGSDLAIEHLYGKYIKNFSIHTISLTGRVLFCFMCFLAENHTSIRTLTRHNVIAFVENEQDRGLKPQSVIDYLRVVYAFIVFLVDQKVLPCEIMERKVKIKIPKTLPRSLLFEDIKPFLQAIKSIRDRALLLLLLRTGMRIDELLEVKMADTSFPERKILIYQGEKNYLGRAVYYSEDAASALQCWLDTRKSDSPYLFPGARKPQLSYCAAYSVMKNTLERAGLLEKGYSLHSLRHTFATDMLNAGMRLEVLQQLMGHQEIEMTIRYARIADQTREYEYFKAMDRIEQGESHEPYRINDQLQKVFEEKKLLRTHSKKLPE